MLSSLTYIFYVLKDGYCKFHTTGKARKHSFQRGYFFSKTKVLVLEMKGGP